MLRFVPALVATSTLLGGCIIPYKYTMQQGATGYIVDAHNSVPITGASIVVVEGLASQIAVSGTDGRFYIPGVSKWGAYIVPMDPMAIRWSLTIHAEGYDEYSTKDWTSVMQSLARDVRVIRLNKKAPNHLPDPSSPSVTPPAGAVGAPSVAADH